MIHMIQIFSKVYSLPPLDRPYLQKAFIKMSSYILVLFMNAAEIHMNAPTNITSFAKVIIISFTSKFLCVQYQSRDLGPVSRSLLCKGPHLVKEGHFYSFGKATFTKPPLTLLTKGLP